MNSKNETSDLSEPDNASETLALTPEELAEQWKAEAPESAGPVANLVACLVVLAVAISGMAISIGLGLGTPQTPKAGTWPFVVCIIIAVMAIVQIIAGRKGAAGGEKFSRLSWYSLIGFVTLLLLIALMPIIGFEIPSLLLCFVWMRWLGGERWRSATLYSVIVVVAFYLIFIVALGTNIPRLF